MRVSSGALARVPDAQVQPRPSPRPVRPSRARPGLSSVCRASDPWASASLVNYTAPSLSRRSTGQIADADDRLREGKKEAPSTQTVRFAAHLCPLSLPLSLQLVVSSGVMRCKEAGHCNARHMLNTGKNTAQHADARRRSSSRMRCSS